MLHRILLIIAALGGISATFLPWLHYPKNDGVFYGYLGDGVFTGFLFLLILVFSIYVYRKKQFPTIASLIFGVMGLLLAFLAYSKIENIEAEKIDFTTNNPIISSVSAGFHQGIGIYVFGIAGLIVFLSILFGWLYQQYGSSSQKEKASPDNRRKVFKYAVGAILAVVILFAGYLMLKPGTESVNEGEFEQVFKKDLKTMGRALMDENYNAFIEYNHPIMIQSYGGRAKLLEILHVSMNEMKLSGRSIKDVRFSKLIDIKRSGNDIQAIINQTMTVSQNGLDQNQIQKMLVVSDNGGANWYYINIEGQTKDEIIKIFPYLIEELKF